MRDLKKKNAKKSQVPKNANKWLKIREKCQKKGGVSFGATIRTGQESRCLPYAGFFKKVFGQTDGPTNRLL